MPGDSGVLVVTRVRSTAIIAHETAGALGIRHSPRPLLGGRFLARLGCSAPRGRERACEEKTLKRRAAFQIRSVNLTIFWHCGTRHFSFRTAWERLPGNEPSMVLAEDARPKGSGNADSQPNVRSSGESGQCRSSRCCSGCVLAHPASWRASASYRPLRAVWAVCAWALRGCARSPEPPQRSKQRALKGIFR